MGQCAWPGSWGLPFSALFPDRLSPGWGWPVCRGQALEFSCGEPRVTREIISLPVQLSEAHPDWTGAALPCWASGNSGSPLEGHPASCSRVLESLPWAQGKDSNHPALGNPRCKLNKSHAELSTR